MQGSIGQNNIQQSQQYSPVTNMQTTAQPQYCTQPQIAANQTQAQSAPNYAGVNIQIFNPSVGVPGSASPVYNVNAPSYPQQTQNAGSQCYPSNYYTDNFNKGQTNNVTNETNIKETKTTESKEEKKTEKREIVQLTDEYIKNLENYLNSQDKEVRMMGAKEVLARLEEDNSRKDDPALNALVNKMLQDPYTPIKILAMGALDSRIATGDDYTVNLLKNMQNSTSGYGQDALQASNILLKMSGQTVEKEFEVKDKPKKESAKG